MHSKDLMPSGVQRRYYSQKQSWKLAKSIGLCVSRSVMCTWLLHYGTHRQKSSRSSGSKHWYILHLHVWMLKNGSLTLGRERSVLVHLEVILKKKHKVFIQVLILEKWRQTKNTNEKWKTRLMRANEGAWASVDRELEEGATLNISSLQILQKEKWSLDYKSQCYLWTHPAHCGSRASPHRRGRAKITSMNTHV